ncbi:cryptochrome/photolyase family protein [Rhodococcoides fascians]|uniref:cryptochrome/photolyase family protein n=1 Tax=Rhodococcoides fascians TaxID=1828 RepID=UPI000B9BBE0D|nr:cryptochrome/photolyase family protein [Rhodococcus fascians]OZE88960.1 cryptochrome/photolyase family protein [Rhodococcus fascians]OZF15745.1 cryptochrome/photolyase family protein [Rhodococcus fascians]OZF19939.1 cryptochrome/photolyase family protein [Rhodococcus fascians]OZF66204.1 cryptochrome/photolyase family protein [Rhodococcus fascians]OZF69356.1 cryptochrome/photolyase family protein [Rhodococcus fascians]
MDALWLFGDQLGPHFHSVDEHAERDVLMIESRRVFRRRRYHRQKLHLVLSGMRHLADELGDRVTYLQTETYREALAEYGKPVVVFEPTSHAAEKFVAALHEEGLVSEILPTPMFALPRAEFADWAAERGTFRMETFYREQRKRFDVLMDGADPVSGKWNLDAENQSPPPKGRLTLGVEEPWWPTEDAIDDEVRADLDSWELDTVGVDGPRVFAVTASEASEALSHFVNYRLDDFGKYEDAVMADDWTMSHSLLSVPLNLGLLQPLDVAHAAEDAHRDGTPLASVEGFIRQILGWREYVWHLYWHMGPEYLERNKLEAHEPLPDWLLELDGDAVVAKCLSSTVDGVRDRGWVHHIPRLMILGNFALQHAWDPRALTEWFATAFVDGFAWVMPVNVIGMSQHADGGVIATKPYASGGAYLNRMTDYCKPCEFNPKKRLGDDACPFTAGYWAFVHRHREMLALNHRTARQVSSMNRLSDLEQVLEQERQREFY